jgi:hypothetical protein
MDDTRGRMQGGKTNPKSEAQNPKQARMTKIQKRANNRQTLGG